MQFERYFVFMALTVGLALNCFATAGHAQGLSDFGLVGQSPIWDKIRQITDQAEFKRIENTRVCNLSVPLAGSADEAANASESDWKETLAAYELWESDYQRRLIFRQPLLQVGDETGRVPSRGQREQSDRGHAVVDGRATSWRPAEARHTGL
jgi:hypothetical protein